MTETIVQENHGVSVILLTWNGLSLLRECLPKIVASLAEWQRPYELLLVDNGSRDGTLLFLQEHYPQVKVIAFSRNLGFARANNQAAAQAQFPTLLFLNNDLYLGANFIEPLMRTLASSEDIFAVAPRILRWDGVTVDDGLRYGRYENGLFSVELEEDPYLSLQPHWVTFFCGACFLCERELFLRMGGFDCLYTPYAWEDLDLAWRAWRRGFRVAYVPEAVAFHKREATTRQAFSQLFFISLMWRNRFIFMWKNLTSRQLLRNHLLCLPGKLLKFTFNGRWRYVVGFFRALVYLPAIFKARRREIAAAKLTDEEILQISFMPRDTSLASESALEKAEETHPFHVDTYKR